MKALILTVCATLTLSVGCSDNPTNPAGPDAPPSGSAVIENDSGNAVDIVRTDSYNDAGPPFGRLTICHQETSRKGDIFAIRGNGGPLHDMDLQILLNGNVISTIDVDTGLAVIYIRVSHKAINAVKEDGKKVEIRAFGKYQDVSWRDAIYFTPREPEGCE